MEKIKAFFKRLYEGIKSSIKKLAKKIAELMKAAAKKGSRMFYDGMKWVNDNKEFAMFLAAVAVKLGKSGAKSYLAYSENVRKRRRFYDPRTGKYSYIRRDLTSYEQNVVDLRYANGESYWMIFYDMGLLK